MTSFLVFDLKRYNGWRVKAPKRFIWTQKVSDFTAVETHSQILQLPNKKQIDLSAV